MKRFYTMVSHSKEQDGYAVLLDGKSVKTADKHVLIAPNEELASAVVQEWAAQEEEIKPDTMPLTQLLNTKIDRVVGQRGVLAPEVLKYLDTDLLCYRAPEPEKLISFQNDRWDPWLDWFEKKYGAKLETTMGLSALSHPKDAHDKAKADVEALSDDQFTLLQMLVPLSGSLVLGLAFMDKAASAEEILKAAFAEEDFKYELYNEDIHGDDPLTRKKRDSAQRDLEAAELYLATLK